MKTPLIHDNFSRLLSMFETERKTRSKNQVNDSAKDVILPESPLSYDSRRVIGNFIVLRSYRYEALKGIKRQEYLADLVRDMRKEFAAQALQYMLWKLEVIRAFEYGRARLPDDFEYYLLQELLGNVSPAQPQK